MNNLKKCGVIYVACSNLRFVCEAICSARTLRRKAPTIPITLFTDITELTGIKIWPFDDILLTHKNFRHTGSKVKEIVWGEGLLGKISGIMNSPYEKTIFIDSDTRILSRKICELFDFLDTYSIALVPCTLEDSSSCIMYGPMFNTGVIAYRKNSKTSLIFKKWERLQKYHLKLAKSKPVGIIPKIASLAPEQRRYLLANDQTSFAELLSPIYNKYQIPIKVLSRVWNARNFPKSRLKSVIIDHACRHKFTPDKVSKFLLKEKIIEG